MDKSWIHLPRVSHAYLNGAAKFIDFAFANASDAGRIRCPCKNCNNNFWVSRKVAYDHIVCDGFNTSYTYWRFHGEVTSSSMPATTNVVGDNSNPHNDMHRLLHDDMPTAGPSQSLPQDPHQAVDSLEDASSDLTFTKRRSRGPTRCHQVWNMREGQRIFITTNNLGQPVNENVSKLTNFLGTIARNGDYTPLTYSNWRAMPSEKKDDMYELVMSKFQFDKEIKSWVLMSIGKKWRDWKCELKKFHYSPHDNDEARLADLNERVHMDQWKALIEFWNSEEGKARNKINTENWKKQRISHTAGTKSFARIRDEERKKRANGGDLTRVDMFLLTHTRKNGMLVDEASSIAMEQLNEQTSQQPEASQNSTARKDIFSKVMGDERHGRVRTYGLGPSPSDIWGITSHSLQSQGMTSNAQKRDEQYEGLHAEISSLRETMADRDAQISSLRETMTTFMAAITNPGINLATLLGISANPNLNQSSSSSSHLVPTPQRDLTNKGNSTSCTNVTQVLLKSIVRLGDTVAKGTVLSTDPLTKVGGQKLGVGFWEVSVQVAMVRDEDLIRTHGRYKTIGDAIGTSIAWPTTLCMVVDRNG